MSHDVVLSPTQVSTYPVPLYNSWRLERGPRQGADNGGRVVVIGVHPGDFKVLVVIGCIEEICVSCKGSGLLSF